MIKTEKNIVIKAPVEEVFAYAADPNHLPEYFTGVDKITDVRRLPNGGYGFKSVNKIAGLHTDMTNEDVEFVANERIVGKSHGALTDSTVTATFATMEGGQTRVTCVEEYTIHGGFLGKLGEAFLGKYFDHAAELTQETLKARIEAGVPALTPH
ncbi:MAG: SRPBCC family protein [Nitrososphaerota archaeon]